MNGHSCKYWMIALLVPVLVSCSQGAWEQTNRPLLHPLGDYSHAEVYDFIVDYVRKFTKDNREQALLAFKIAEEVDREIATGEVLKPPIVSAYESSMSNILHVFCQHFPTCRSLSLYASSGEILAAASKKEAYASLIIADDLYQRYQDGILTGPYINKESHETTYPIYLSSQGYATHFRPEATDKPIGFIVYEIQ